MTVSKKLKSRFSSIEKCYIPLLSYEVNTCVKCGSKQFYKTILGFEKVCKKCKKRYKNTYNTLFHNVRFGLLKAFHIYIEVNYEEPQPKASVLAKRYKLTYKTAYVFKKKVIDSNEFLNLQKYLKKDMLKNERKLLSFIEREGIII